MKSIIENQLHPVFALKSIQQLRNRADVGHTKMVVGLLLTLYSELSTSACPIDRFGGVEEAENSDGLLPSSSCFPSPEPTVKVLVLVEAEDATLGGCSCVGLRAPHILKLSFARRHCSTKYGQADSRRLPIICRDISNPASCCHPRRNTI